MKNETLIEDALVKYKNIGCVIIEKLVSDEYDALDGLFKLREQELVKIKQLAAKGEQLKEEYESLNIDYLDNDIRNLINEKKKKLIEEYTMLEKKNNAAIKYKKNYKNLGFNMFNIKL